MSWLDRLGALLMPDCIPQYEEYERAQRVLEVSHLNTKTKEGLNRKNRGAMIDQNSPKRSALRTLMLVAASALVGAIGLPTILTVFATPPQTPTPPAFDVASIKIHPPPLTRISITQQPGGRLVAEGMSLKMLVARAYSVPEIRILGGPNWADSDHFDIEAKAQGGTIVPGQMPLMLQA